MNMASLVMTKWESDGGVHPLQSISNDRFGGRFCEPAIFVSAVDTPESLKNRELYRALLLWYYYLGSDHLHTQGARHQQDFYMFK